MRLVARVCALALFLALGCLTTALAASRQEIVATLSACYPDLKFEEQAGAGLVVIPPSGTRLVYDDAKTKSFDEMLDYPDIKDMFSQTYPLGAGTPEPGADFDPGRVRSNAFFAGLYGKDKAAVKANCVSVDFAGTQVLFNSRYGAAEALRAVGRDIAEIIKSKPEYRRYVFPLGGSFAYREIAGTSRLSPHSFGIAIDLNPKYGGYWRWDNGPRKISTSGFPMEIVEAFERHGFIWGGKWHHHDLMHFEYRPEIIKLATPAEAGR